MWPHVLSYFCKCFTGKGTGHAPQLSRGKWLFYNCQEAVNSIEHEISLSYETCQDFFIKPGNKNFILSHPSSLHTLPCPTACPELLGCWLVFGGHKHRMWLAPGKEKDSGPSLTFPRLIPLVTCPMWIMHPLQKAVGWLHLPCAERSPSVPWSHTGLEGLLCGLHVYLVFSPNI